MDSLITLPIPGTRREDLEVSVQGGVVSVHVKKGPWAGRRRYAVRDAQNLEARYTDGVLTISRPEPPVQVLEIQG